MCSIVPELLICLIWSLDFWCVFNLISKVYENVQCCPSTLKLRSGFIVLAQPKPLSTTNLSSIPCLGFKHSWHRRKWHWLWEWVAPPSSWCSSLPLSRRAAPPSSTYNTFGVSGFKFCTGFIRKLKLTRWNMFLLFWNLELSCLLWNLEFTLSKVPRSVLRFTQVLPILIIEWL